MHLELSNKSTLKSNSKSDFSSPSYFNVRVWNIYELYLRYEISRPSSFSTCKDLFLYEEGTSISIFSDIWQLRKCLRRTICCSYKLILRSIISRVPKLILNMIKVWISKKCMDIIILKDNLTSRLESYIPIRERSDEVVI